jgi:hypothetical protein
MKLEDIKELNLPHYQHNPDSKEITIGDYVAKAEISTAADAWVEGYAKKGNSYHFSFQGGISQHEDPRFPGSKDKSKDFPVYILGIVDEGKVHNLAYATSRDHDTKKINTLRLTNLDKITHIGDYRLVLRNE